MNLADQINILADFCGVRDIDELSSEALSKKYNFAQADIMVLFGGSILAGGDVFAEAMKNQIAKKYIIVGGAGHTTEMLRLKMKELYPCIDAANMSEAELFNEYIFERYNLRADYLECDSTNCGNNITYLLDLIDREQINCQSMILTQDSTMQRRMTAGLKKYRPEILAINFAAYRAKVMNNGSELTYDTEILGMWNIERYVTLLLGEIPRLTDDVNGYGPKGKDFIAHVDIPQKIQAAFDEVIKYFKVRNAINNGKVSIFFGNKQQ